MPILSNAQQNHVHQRQAGAKVPVQLRIIRAGGHRRALLPVDAVNAVRGNRHVLEQPLPRQGIVALRRVRAHGALISPPDPPSVPPDPGDIRLGRQDLIQESGGVSARERDGELITPRSLRRRHDEGGRNPRDGLRVRQDDNLRLSR